MSDNKFGMVIVCATLCYQFTGSAAEFLGVCIVGFLVAFVSDGEWKQ